MAEQNPYQTLKPKGSACLVRLDFNLSLVKPVFVALRGRILFREALAWGVHQVPWLLREDYVKNARQEQQPYPVVAFPAQLGTTHCLEVSVLPVPQDSAA